MLISNRCQGSSTCQTIDTEASIWSYTILVFIHFYRFRTLLVNSYILSTVPPINFVKDAKQIYMQDMEHLLAIADYGPDFEPSDSYTQYLRKQEVIHKKLTPDIENEIIAAEVDYLGENGESVENTNLTSDEDPELMKQNIYGLDHKKLMEIVKAKKFRQKGLHRLDSAIGQSNSQQPILASTMPFLSTDDRAVKFSEFIKQKRKDKILAFNQKYAHISEDIKEMDQERLTSLLVWEENDDDDVLNISDSYDYKNTKR